MTSETVYAQQRRVELSPELVSEIYAQHMTQLFFPNLVTYMSSGPVLVMQLAREKAVSYWREICGPSNPARARITHPDRSAVYSTVCVSRNSSSSSTN